MTRFIFITGGVVSSLGKGLSSAALGALLLPPLEGIALPGYTAIACLLLAAVFLAPTLSHLAFDRLPAAGPPWRRCRRHAAHRHRAATAWRPR